MGELFSFEGRINRGTFWKYYAILLVGYVLAAFLWAASIDTYTGEPSGGMMLLAVVVWLALLPISLSMNIRRWHDLDKSGWWMLIVLVPFIGALYAFIMTGFVAGTPGPNSYGYPHGHHGVASTAPQGGLY